MCISQPVAEFHVFLSQNIFNIVKTKIILNTYKLIKKFDLNDLLF